jgi:hypothetical protein
MNTSQYVLELTSTQLAGHHAKFVFAPRRTRQAHTMRNPITSTFRSTGSHVPRARITMNEAASHNHEECAMHQDFERDEAAAALDLLGGHPPRPADSRSTSRVGPSEVRCGPRPAPGFRRPDGTRAMCCCCRPRLPVDRARAGRAASRSPSRPRRTATATGSGSRPRTSGQAAASRRDAAGKPAPCSRPYCRLTGTVRKGPNPAMSASGIGITPLRALFAELPYPPRGSRAVPPGRGGTPTCCSAGSWTSSPRVAGPPAITINRTAPPLRCRDRAGRRAAGREPGGPG